MSIESAVIIYAVIGVWAFFTGGIVAETLKFKDKESWAIAVMSGWLWPIIVPIAIIVTSLFASSVIYKRMKNIQ